MRNAIRAALGLTVAVTAVFGSLGAGDHSQDAGAEKRSVSTR
ncbi:hypothetical protein [Streptosporangium pseudovulgare]|nr:hypothetical protein [Streptosporangium pseudovulgare]